MTAGSVCGLGNAIVDIIVQVSDEDVQKFNLKKGDMTLVDEVVQKELLAGVSDVKPALVSGGAVANSIIAFSELGGKASFLSSIGDDRYGLHYESEFKQLAINLPNPLTVGGVTGTCVIFVTPDAERTMQTNLGISAELGPMHINEKAIAASEWIVVEGYVLSNEVGQAAVKKAIQVAKENNTKIALLFAAEFIASVFRDQLTEAMQDADLVIANAEEAKVFCQQDSISSCFDVLTRDVEHVVITDGSNGAFVKQSNGLDLHVPAIKTTAKDTTGAGDMFTGAYMYGLANSFEVEDTVRRSCFLASKVIEQLGARLDGDLKELWNSIEA